MNRENLLARARQETNHWDVVVIGGGATGVGIALDAVSRGYITLLVEQSDFGKGTSSRSTKLIHGGVRYLRQGNIKLVTEALFERSVILRNAPHVARTLSIVLPSYKWWEKPFYGIGLKVYDALAGRRRIGHSRLISKEEAVRLVPTLEPESLKGGVLFQDGQFDDARLLISLARTAVDHGAVLLNYCRAEEVLKGPDGQVVGIRARDLETDESFIARGRSVINATGVFTDAVRHLDDPHASPLVQPSQGIHLVVDRKFLPGDTAMMIPKTDDGRVLFAIPWHDHVVLGTTDTPVADVSLEPRALEEEIHFVLSHACRYLSSDPTRADVRSVYVGQRPLVRAAATRSTASLSRDHTIVIEPSGMLTITGGKWTTYRRMAQDAVDRVARLAHLAARPSTTAQIMLHGAKEGMAPGEDFSPYGVDVPAVDELCRSVSGGGEAIHPRIPYRAGEVVWAARYEMARTVEDVLARRTRALFLDAQASLEAAPAVARLLAQELQRNRTWEQEQTDAFTSLARGYLLPS